MSKGKGFDGNNWIKEVYHQKFSVMCNTAYRFLGNKETAEDVVQEIFTRFLADPPDINQISNLNGYLFITVRNACLNTLQGLKREQELKVELKNIHPRADIDDLDEETRFLVLKHIFDTVNDLPDRCKEVCKLVLFSDLNTHQIAEKLNITEQTVRNQKSKGINLIKTGLLKKRLFAAYIIFIQLFGQ